MPRIVEYELANGPSVYVEVDDAAGGLQKAALDQPTKAEKSLDQALDGVMPTAERLITRVQALDRKPSGVEIELGIKFNVKTGAVIASTALEGNIKVKLIWTPQSAHVDALAAPPR